MQLSAGTPLVGVIGFAFADKKMQGRIAGWRKEIVIETLAK
jgi:hypothetical protein